MLDPIVEFNKALVEIMQLRNENRELKEKVKSLEIDREDVDYRIGECTCGVDFAG